MTQALSKINLSGVRNVALNEIVSEYERSYVIVLIDLDREQKLVFFVTTDKGKNYLVQFRHFLYTHSVEATPEHRRGSLR